MGDNRNDAGMKAEGKNVRGSISLPESWWRRLDELADGDDCEGNRSRLIRRALRPLLAAGTPDADDLKAARQA